MPLASDQVVGVRVLPGPLGTKMLKTGYLGYLGQQNLGDEACFLGVKELLKEHLKFDYEIIGARNHKSKDYKLFICGGGTLLSAYENWEWTLKTGDMIKAGIPVVIFGSGMQPLDYKWFGKPLTEKGKELLRFVVNKSKLVGVRSQESKQNMIKAGCDGERIEVIGDPALVCTSFGGRDLIDIKNYKNLVGINIGHSRGNIFGRDEERLKKEVIKFVDYLIKNDYKVVFFPVWVEDLEIQRSIVNAINSDNIISVNHISNVPSTIKLIQELNLLVGMKLHSCIFAASVNTPFVSLAYRPKCIEFAKSLGCHDYVVRTDENVDMMINVFEKTWSQRNNIKDKLMREVPKYQKRLHDFAERINSI